MKRFLAAIFFCCSIFVFSAPAADNLSEEEKLRQIQEQLEESKVKLRQTKEQERAVLGRLAVINKELRSTNQKLNFTMNKIRLNEGQIGQLRSELRLSEGNLRAKEDKFKARLSEMYKGGTTNYLEVLVASRSMSDFLNRLYFFSKIIEVDANLVQGIRADVQTVKVKKGSLEERTEEIKGLAKVVAQKKDEFVNLAEEKKGIYDKLKERREEYERQVAELEKSSNELESLILKKTAAGKGTKVQGSGRMIWPLRGRITSPFGWRRSPWGGRRQMHTGLDIANTFGSPIAAADAGEVIFAGWWDGYGKAIVVDHGKGITTVYGHLSRIYKQVGDVVGKGQTIGLEGSTGYSTGPHLHFEVRVKGKPVNPMGYLK